MRRGRGRSNLHRREFSTRQPNVQEMGQQVVDQQQQPQQHHQHLQQQSQPQQSMQPQPNYTPQYLINPYAYYSHPPVQVGFPSAQHATGSPLYATAGHMPMYAPAPHYYSYHPGMMYPHIIPADYSIIDGKSADDQPAGGSTDPAVVGAVPNIHGMQHMWHPAPMWHTAAMPPQPMSDEYIQDEMDEYTYQQQQQSIMEQNSSSHMLSPIYTNVKDDQTYLPQQQLHHTGEYMTGAGPPSTQQHPLHHLSPQQMLDPQQLHQQQQHQQQQQQHLMMPYPNDSGMNEYVMAPQQISTSIIGDTDPGTTNILQNDHLSIDNINNNNEIDKDHMLEALSPRQHQQEQQYSMMLVNSVDVQLPMMSPPPVVFTNSSMNNNMASPVSSSSLSSYPSGEIHPSILGYTSATQITSNNNNNPHTISTGLMTEISTEDLNKIANSSTDKLIMKSDRSMSSSSNSNKISSSWHKKNTANVSVSAVPIPTSPVQQLQPQSQPKQHNPPAPFAITATIDTTIAAALESASISKPFVPTKSIDSSQKREIVKVPSNGINSSHPQVSVAAPTDNINTPGADVPVMKAPVSTSSIASTAVPQQFQQELRSKQVEVVPQWLIKESTEATTGSTIISTVQPTVVATSTVKDVLPQAKQQQAPQVPPASTTSWAALFAGKTSHPIKSHHTEQPKKPIAKVSPFDNNASNVSPSASPGFSAGPTTIAHPSTTITPTVSTTTATSTSASANHPTRVMSYSAASSQGLPAPNSTVTLTNASKKQVTKATVAPSKPAPQSEEMSSLKLGGKLTTFYNVP